MPQEPTRKVLLFGGGPIHDFRGACSQLQAHLAEDGTFGIDLVVEDYDAFLAQRLELYDLVVLYHTGGTLAGEQVSGLTRWVAAGGGLAAVHCAADSFKGNPEYIAMLGGVFVNHPPIRPYYVSLLDPAPGTESLKSHLRHPITCALTAGDRNETDKHAVYEYLVEDEQYLLDFDQRVDVLARTIYKGHPCPVAWTRPWGTGRVFYLALGHDPQACQNSFFKQMFQCGTRWAAGLI